MATTWIRPIHASSSIASVLNDRIDYVLDYNKTDAGEYTLSYECDVTTADADFLLGKKLYEKFTGRTRGNDDILAYHVRQSFKPGEVTPEQALEIGYDLAMRWTKGKHQFIVAAHTNTNNPHIHIIYNAVNLDYSKKFRNFKYSIKALRRLSDHICIENGLSFIENPKPSKGWNRTEYLGVKKSPNKREKLINLINTFLCDSSPAINIFDALKNAGCNIKYGK